MQVTAAGFTAEERDATRKIAASAQVAWKKQLASTWRPFTIGVSAIGGSDGIASDGATVSDWNKYYYFDESRYLQSLSYERGLKMPTGGLSMGMFEANFDNTSGRFTPRYMGGNSELYTASYKPMRPTIINAGFNYNGVDQTIPQFVGINPKPMSVDARSRTAKIAGNDFMAYLQNTYLDHQVMFTAQRTDQVLASLFSDLGYSTAQYDLDYGVNIIPFGMFDVGSRFSDVVDKLVEAENGQAYQREDGKFIFENRQHWDSPPYTSPVKVIYTAEVLEAESPDDSHLINVVEINGKVIEKQPSQLVWKLSSPIQVDPTSNAELFVSFDDPMLQIDDPSTIYANLQSDGSSTDMSDYIQIKSISKFAQAAKVIFYNSSSSPVYITSANIYGRVAKTISDIKVRVQDDSSVTAYQERPFAIDNKFIQSQDWASSYAQMILNDFSEPENIQKITVRAKPDLQLGDLISWQGRYWRVFDIKSVLSPSSGFVQELTLLQRTITTYFRIGISSIGGVDRIAP